MSNQIYPLALTATFGKGLDWDTDDIRATFVLATYTYASTDEFLSDINAAVGGASGTLTSPTLAVTALGMTFDAADTAATPTTGQAINAVVVYRHTGTGSTSELLLYIDTGQGTIFTSDGSQYEIGFSNGPSKVFAISNYG